ncbi:hypothetical protein HJB89_25360 [Rhizobium sp. NZLR8]|uniref:hypothetical protein n=1 Tax=Rhizobium sp. NZLR8 TaxID=2731104 RepID=UPI001C836BAE|nr:hypothetical protein [Rhizobium sp. NZLR8]MBX5160416.1 hypothetical protein [Rhizobium sp. NZLR8]
MTEYTNDLGPVEILGLSPASNRHTLVRMEVHAAYLEDIPQEYVVYTATMRWRMDGQPHPLDVREVKVLSSEAMANEDGSVSVVLEVKG